MGYEIRDEQRADAQAITKLTRTAFTKPNSTGAYEVAVVEGLRSAGALTISLVAAVRDGIIGHVAFSPVQVDGKDVGWFGLGPLSVSPDEQKKGVGSALVREGLSRLKDSGAKGCVLLGDAGYYQRFGFVHEDGLRYEGAPAEHFMCMSFDGPVPRGVVCFHEAFPAS